MALWGSGLYGQGLYSAPGPVDFAGNLAPAISLRADLTIVGKADLVGDLRPQITFRGDLSVTVALQTVQLQGGYYFSVNFSGDMISGPLWKPTPPCDLVEWEEAELCHG